MRRLRLSAFAVIDIEDILLRSELSYGEAARQRYEALLEAALRDVAGDPDRPGVRQREELAPGARTYHLFYSRQRGRTDLGIVRRPRHVLLFRLKDPETVEIGRVLHDAMEPAAHLPADYAAHPLEQEEEED